METAGKSMGGGGSGMEDKRWGKRRTLRLGKTSGKVEGALCRKNRGKSSRKASVEKRHGKRRTLRMGNRLGKVEGALWRTNIACEKHGWRRKHLRCLGSRLFIFSQKHLRCLGSRLVSLPGAPRYRRARFGAAKWVRKTAGNVSGGKIVEIACETRRWRRGTGRKTREIACGKHRWRRGTGSAKKDKSRK